MTMVRAGYPLYLQVKSWLLEKIDSGEWPNGTMIPTEHDLISLHSVSRTTVRQAIQDLVSSGYLVRQQGKGTYVARPDHSYTSSQLYGFVEEFEYSGRRVEIQSFSVEIVPCDDLVAAQLRIPTSESVARVSRVAVENGAPVFYEESFFPASVYEWLHTDREFESRIYLALEAQGIIISSGEQEISAEVATADQAAILCCAVGDPVMHIKRTTKDRSGHPIEYSIARYRAHSYVYRVRLMRSV